MPDQRQDYIMFLDPNGGGFCGYSPAGELEAKNISRGRDADDLPNDWMAHNIPAVRIRNLTQQEADDLVAGNQDLKASGADIHTHSIDINDHATAGAERDGMNNRNVKSKIMAKPLNPSDIRRVKP